MLGVCQAVLLLYSVVFASELAFRLSYRFCISVSCFCNAAICLSLSATSFSSFGSSPVPSHNKIWLLPSRCTAASDVWRHSPRLRASIRIRLLPARMCPDTAVRLPTEFMSSRPLATVERQPHGLSNDSL